MWGTVGYFARRFLDQQRSNHQDTREALDGIKEIRTTLPRVLWRLTRLEVAACVGAIVGAAVAYRKR